MAAENEVYLRFKVENDGSIGVFDQAGNKIEALNKKVEEHSKGTGSLKASYVAVAAGAAIALAGIVAFVGGAHAATRAADEQSRAVALMDSTLRSSGQSSVAFRDQLIDLSGAMQRTAAIGDESVLSVERLLVSYGAGPNVIERVTRASLDLATALGGDVQSAATLVGKAIAGEFGTLGRYGIFVDDNASKTEKLEQALVQIETRFGGSAAAAAATYGGRIQGISLAVDDLLEEFGGIITESDAVGEGLEGIRDTVEDLTGHIRDWVSENHQLLEQDLGTVMYAIAEGAKLATSATAGLVNAFTELRREGAAGALEDYFEREFGLVSAQRQADKRAREQARIAAGVAAAEQQPGVSLLDAGPASASPILPGEGLAPGIADAGVRAGIKADADRRKEQAEAAEREKEAAKERAQHEKAVKEELREQVALIEAGNAQYETAAGLAAARLDAAKEEIAHQVELAGLRSSGSAAEQSALAVEQQGRERLLALAREADDKEREALEHKRAAYERISELEGLSALERQKAIDEIEQLNAELAIGPQHVAELNRQFEITDAKARAAQRTVFEVGSTLKEGFGRELQAAFTRGDDIDFGNVAKSFATDFGGALVDAQLKKLEFDDIVIDNFTGTIPDAVAEGGTIMSNSWGESLSSMFDSTRRGTGGILGLFTDTFRGVLRAGGGLVDSLSGLLRNVPGLGQIGNLGSLFGGAGSAAAGVSAAGEAGPVGISLAEGATGQVAIGEGIPIGVGGGTHAAGAATAGLGTGIAGGLAGIGLTLLAAKGLSSAFGLSERDSKTLNNAGLIGAGIGLAAGVAVTTFAPVLATTVASAVATGATAGSVVPVLGTIIGAIIGLLAGGIVVATAKKPTAEGFAQKGLASAFDQLKIPRATATVPDALQRDPVTGDPFFYDADGNKHPVTDATLETFASINKNSPSPREQYLNLRPYGLPDSGGPVVRPSAELIASQGGLLDAASFAAIRSGVIPAGGRGENPVAAAEFTKNALLNNYAALNLDNTTARNLTKRFATSLLGEDLETALLSIQRNLVLTKAGFAQQAFAPPPDVIKTVAGLIDAYEELPASIDKVRLAHLAFTEDGQLNLTGLREAIDDVRVAMETTEATIGAGFDAALNGKSMTDGLKDMERELRTGIGRSLRDAITKGVAESGGLTNALLPLEGAIGKVFSNLRDGVANPLAELGPAFNAALPDLTAAIKAQAYLTEAAKPYLDILTAPDRADAARDEATNFRKVASDIRFGQLSPGQQEAQKRERLGFLDRQLQQLEVGGFEGSEIALAQKYARERGDIAGELLGLAGERYGNESSRYRQAQTEAAAIYDETARILDETGTSIDRQAVIYEANTAATEKQTAATDKLVAVLEKLVAQGGVTVGADGGITLNVDYEATGSSTPEDVESFIRMLEAALPRLSAAGKLAVRQAAGTA